MFQPTWPGPSVNLYPIQGDSVGEEVSSWSGGAVKYVALYDYDPMSQSPNDNPETELAFCEGDIIEISGPMDEV